jgi:glycosyltransferase involved in cell wall biosynthesis
MRIVIDLQSCQTGSRKGGIGRYSLSLVREMLRNSRGHDFWVVLSNLFPEQIYSVKEALVDVLPPDRIRVFHLNGPVSPVANNYQIKFNIAALMRESFIQSLQPDLVFITSLFEGLYEEAVTSVGLIGDTRKTAVTLYDLIPLVDKDTYLNEDIKLNFYMSKIEYLKKSGLSLAISEFSKQEGINLLGLSETSTVNISSAISPYFQKIDLSFEEELRLKKKLGIQDKFIMYTSSYDVRKNQAGLIKAFASIPFHKRSNYQLVFIGNGWPSIYSDLRNVAFSSGLEERDIVFPGYVNDEELRQLYNLTSLFVCPSFREGFGLPVLEAMSCGAPTIGSNTTSIPEVIGRSDALFDPYNFSDIGEKIYQGLFNEDFNSSLQGHALKQASKFSWLKSATTALDAFEQTYINCNDNPSRIISDTFISNWNSIFVNNSLYGKIAEISEIKKLSKSELAATSRCISLNLASAEAVLREDLKEKSSLKIAWVTTWNTRCGIATYSAPVIKNTNCNNHVFAPFSSELVSEDEDNVLRCWEQGSGELSGLNKALNDFSPAVIVIQFNYGFFDFKQLSNLISNQKKLGRKIFVILHSTQDPPPNSLDRQLFKIKDELSNCRLLVHTKADVTRLYSLGLIENVDQIPLGVHEAASYESSCQLSTNKVIATYGFALPNKGFVELVTAFSKLSENFQNYKLILVAAEFKESTNVSKNYIQKIKDLVLELGLSSRVRLITDYLTNAESLSNLRMADLVVIPYQGTSESSSGSARIALLSGRPTAVTPNPIFSDLEGVVSLLPGMTVDDIRAGLEDLINQIENNDPRIIEMINNAAIWVRSHSFSSIGRYIFSEALLSLEKDY